MLYFQFLATYVKKVLSIALLGISIHPGLAMTYLSIFPNLVPGIGEATNPPLFKGHISVILLPQDTPLDSNLAVAVLREVNPGLLAAHTS